VVGRAGACVRVRGGAGVRPRPDRVTGARVGHTRPKPSCGGLAVAATRKAPANPCCGSSPSTRSAGFPIQAARHQADGRWISARLVGTGTYRPALSPRRACREGGPVVPSANGLRSVIEGSPAPSTRRGAPRTHQTPTRDVSALCRVAVWAGRCPQPATRRSRYLGCGPRWPQAAAAWPAGTHRPALGGLDTAKVGSVAAGVRSATRRVAAFPCRRVAESIASWLVRSLAGWG
jgi:hypothetical protein